MREGNDRAYIQCIAAKRNRAGAVPAGVPARVDPADTNAAFFATQKVTQRGNFLPPSPEILKRPQAIVENKQEFRNTRT
ncbi:MAG: hypothetical protein K2X62_11590 [Beijerinckiaceae bacterium]|jgi:hypothetical protein|nr:hypothetical protein [Beijerinckiaceae bacterium]